MVRSASFTNKSKPKIYMILLLPFDTFAKERTPILWWPTKAAWGALFTASATASKWCSPVGSFFPMKFSPIHNFSHFLPSSYPKSWLVKLVKWRRGDIGQQAFCGSHRSATGMEPMFGRGNYFKIFEKARRTMFLRDEFGNLFPTQSS